MGHVREYEGSSGWQDKKWNKGEPVHGVRNGEWFCLLVLWACMKTSGTQRIKSKFSLSERCCEMEVNARVALMDCLNSGYLCFERERDVLLLYLLYCVDTFIPTGRDWIDLSIFYSFSSLNSLNGRSDPGNIMRLSRMKKIFCLNKRSCYCCPLR